MFEPSRPTRKKLVVLGVSIATGLSIYGGGVALQNTGTPAPGDSPSGSPIVMPDGTPSASPVATPEGTPISPIGTPISSPLGTPEASPTN